MLRGSNRQADGVCLIQQLIDRLEPDKSIVNNLTVNRDVDYVIVQSHCYPAYHAILINPLILTYTTVQQASFWSRLRRFG